MSLILRRKAGGDGVTINHGQCVVRVVRVDPDQTVHLSFNAKGDVHVLREELVDTPPRDYSEDDSDNRGNK